MTYSQPFQESKTPALAQPSNTVFTKIGSSKVPVAALLGLDPLQHFLESRNLPEGAPWRGSLVFSASLRMCSAQLRSTSTGSPPTCLGSSLHRPGNSSPQRRQELWPVESQVTGVITGVLSTDSRSPVSGGKCSNCTGLQCGCFTLKRSVTTIERRGRGMAAVSQSKTEPCGEVILAAAKAPRPLSLEGASPPAPSSCQGQQARKAFLQTLLRLSANTSLLLLPPMPRNASPISAGPYKRALGEVDRRGEKGASRGQLRGLVQLGGSQRALTRDCQVFPGLHI